MKSYEPTKAAVRIGEILQDCGMVTEADLERALDLSKSRSIRLGEALVELGLLSEDQLTWALGVQFDLSFVDLNREMIDWDWLISLPLEELLKTQLLPLTVAEGVAHTVIADPTTPGLRETLRALFPDFRVLVQVASEEAILEMLEEARVRRENTTGTRAALARRGILPGPDRPLDGWVRRLTNEDADAMVALSPGRGQTDACPVEILQDGRTDSRTIPPTELDRLREDLELRLARRKALETGLDSSFGLLSLETGEVVRAGYMEGVGRRLLVIEVVKDRIPPAERLPIYFLHGRDPVHLKALALRLPLPSRAEGLPPAFALEVWADTCIPGVFQVEIPDEAARLRALRWILGAVRPRVTFLEIEKPDEVRRVCGEPAWPATGALVIVPRAPLIDAELGVLPPGVEPVLVAGADDEQVLEELRNRLNGEVTR